MIYCAPPPSALICEPLDAFTAVFHRSSGITHLLVAPAPQILAALTPDGCSLDELLARLARDFDLVDADSAAVNNEAPLQARLDELVAAGLVTRRDARP